MIGKKSHRNRRKLLDLIPLETIYEGGIGRNKVDGGLFQVLEITPVSLGLRDEAERKELLRAYHDFISRLPGPVALYALDVTPELGDYLEAVRERAQEAASPTLHAAALELHGYLRALLAGQKVREKRFYLAIPQPPRATGAPAGPLLTALIAPFLPAARREAEQGRAVRLAALAEGLLQRGRDIAAHLARLGLAARACGPEELLNLVRRAYDPTRPPVTWRQANRAAATFTGEEEAGR